MFNGCLPEANSLRGGLGLPSAPGGLTAALLYAPVLSRSGSAAAAAAIIGGRSAAAAAGVSSGIGIGVCAGLQSSLISVIKASRISAVETVIPAPSKTCIESSLEFRHCIAILIAAASAAAITAAIAPHIHSPFFHVCTVSYVDRSKRVPILPSLCLSPLFSSLIE